MEDGKVYLGADSAASRDHHVTLRKDKKVFRIKTGEDDQIGREELVIAYIGSFRMGQILKHGLELPCAAASYDPYDYMVEHFVERVREVMDKGGFLTRNEDLGDVGGEFLVAFRGRLFTIYADFQVAEGFEPYQAAGSGREYAIGALAASQSLRMKPTERIVQALEIAAKYTGSVRPPWSLEVLLPDAED